jgi:hypothetical protein
MYFDEHYLVRGLTLYRSLTRHANPFVLWVLCLDDFTCDALSKLDLPNLRPISLQELEHDDEALLAAKQNRSQVEYYFTCTPSWSLYILNHFPEVDLITYLDADLFFYSSPAPIYEELGDQSVLIVGHRFPEHLRHLEEFGIYNVGLLAFRDDPYGRECLQWWRDRCLEWCYDRVDNGRFADQKYLDDWPVRFQRLVVLQHKGAGLAAWNLGNHSLSLENGQVLVDSQPLVFFHLQGFKQIGRWLYDPGLAIYGVHADSLLKQHIYKPYIRGLCDSARWLSGPVGQSHIEMGSIRHSGPAVPMREGMFRRAARKSKHQLAVAKKVLLGDLWVVIAGRIL